MTGSGRVKAKADKHIGKPVGKALQLGEGVAARVPISLLVHREGSTRDPKKKGR
jgi:hypothetical protein